MTKNEAALITESDFAHSSGMSIFRYYFNQYFSGQVLSFDEFEYFSGVTVIPRDCFSFVTLDSIKLPPLVTEIGRGAFSYSYLKTIKLNEGLSKIGIYSFLSCDIETVVIPSTCEIIEWNAFELCKKLKEINFPASLIEIGSAAFKDTALTRVVFQECESLTIKNNAFQSIGLVEVVLAEGITSIGEYAFADNNIRSLTIPRTLTKISRYAFKNNEIETLVLQENLRIIEVDAFAHNRLTSIYIPSTAELQGKSCFAYNDIKSIEVSPDSSYYYMSNGCLCRKDAPHVYLATYNATIPDGTTHIYRVWEGNTLVESVSIPASVTYVDVAFAGCVNLKTIMSKCISAPTAYYSFGEKSLNNFTGQNTRDTGENMLYVPSSATGYEDATQAYGTNQWLDPLQNAEKCGFTISYSL
jgi:hypothetical protein